MPPLKIKTEQGADFPEDKIFELEKELLEAFHNRLKVRRELEEKVKIAMALKPVWKEERIGDMFDIAYFEPV